MRGLALLLLCAAGARAQSTWSPAWSQPELKFQKAPPPAPPPRPFATAPLSYSGARLLAPSEYPAFADDLDPDSLAAAAEQSDAYWSRLGDLTEVRIGRRRYTVGLLRASARELVRLAALGPAALQAQLPARFDVFESVSGGVVFTAYYAPEIEAAAAPDAAHPTPILEAPGEPVSWTRARIDRGALAGRDLALAWASPADVYDLQLEGSGTLLMDGRRRRLEFDSSNGRPFRSPARALLDRGLLPEGADFLDYLRSLPVERQLAILEVNPRYTFFHDAPPGMDGPVGSLGAMLTPGRSLALSAEMPRGVAAFIDVGGIRRLAFAQDSGDAISDPGRADLFWGSGPQAGAEARRFKSGGRLYFLVLKNAPSN